MYHKCVAYTREDTCSGNTHAHMYTPYNMTPSVRGIIFVGYAIALLLELVSADRGLPNATLYMYGEEPVKYGDNYAVKCYAGGYIYIYPAQGDTWRADEKCTQPKCEPYNLQETQKISHKRTTLNVSMRVSCKNGYAVEETEGPEVRVLEFRCQKKRRKRCTVTTNENCLKFFWKSQTRDTTNRMIKTITCKERKDYCFAPDDPPHLILNNTLEPSGFHIGDLVQVSCKAGYTHSEKDRYITCGVNGMWDNSFGYCISTESIRCTLPIIDHMIDISKEVYKVGDSITIECEPKYYVDPASTLGAMKCTIHKEWKMNQMERTPTCKPIRCPVVGEVQQADVHYIRKDSIATRGMGSQVEVKCYSSYKLLGSALRTCTDGGSWDGELQRCDLGRSMCKNPGTPISGSQIGTDYDLHDEVTFECNREVTFSGSNIRKCLSSGEWSGMEAKCTGPKEFPSKKELKELMSTFITSRSKDTKISEQSVQKTQNLMGKDLFLGTTNMKEWNPDAKTALNDLLDMEGLDIYFLLDLSGSIAMDQKNLSIQVIKECIKKFQISPNEGGTNIGIVAFTNIIEYKIVPKELSNANEYIQVLDTWDLQKEGGTNPNLAFKVVHTLIKTLVENKVVAIVYLSDGLTNEGPPPHLELEEIKKTIKAGNAGHDRKLHVYCLGVGNPDRASLNNLASEGKEYLILARSWTSHYIALKLLYNRNGTAREFKCGNSRVKPIPTGTVSDKYAIKDQWPWTAALYYMTSGIPVFTCGASLICDYGNNSIGSRWVLTAAHCIKRDETYRVKLGSIYSESEQKGDNAISLGVEKSEKHTAYNSRTLLNDIALLRLEDSAPFDYSVNAVCLPIQGSPVGIQQKQQATMTGWGYLSSDNKTISDELKQLNLLITSSKRCNAAAAKLEKAEYDEALNFCAEAGPVEYNRKWDACKMDSGSPLVVEKTDTVNGADVQWVQIGIVSGGGECGKEPGLYTKVSTYIDWIKEIQRNFNN